MKKTILLLLLSAFCGLQAEAEKVSEQEALATAQAFFNHQGLSRTASAVPLQLAHTSNGYYAFNRGEAEGFVLVAADDCFSRPVLGYADQGSFDTDNMPENMRWWLGLYDRALNAAQKSGNTFASKAVQKTSTASERANIEPLVTALWDQGEPYNAMCPTYNGMRCPTGCLATALAQIIHCNKYPTQGTGTHSYDWTVNLVSQGILSVDFEEHTYQYELMNDTYNEASSEESRQAVAQLMYDLGVLSEMAYKPAISSAPTFTALLGLVNNLKYDKSAILRSREFYTDKEWIEMVYANLAEGYPLCYTGQNQWAGHAFVCDGYRDGYFHINWGWSGGSNGYFLLDALSPGSQGIGGSSGGYNDGQEALFNLKPAQSDSKYEVLMYNYKNFDIEQKKLSASSQAAFTGSFCNLGIAGQDITLGLKVTDSNGNVTWIKERASSHINSLAGVETIVVNLSEFPNSAGSYRVYPAYQDENGTWKEMRTKKNFPKHYLTASVAQGEITFCNPLQFSNWTPSEEVIAEKEFSVQVDIENNTGANFSDSIRLALMAYGTSDIIDYSNEQALTLPNNSTTSLTFTMTAPKLHGFYNYFVVDSRGENISDVARLTVEENTETTQEFKLSLHSMEVSQNANNVNVTANISCESGRYNGFIAFYIFPENGGMPVDYTYTGFYIREGETQTATNTDEFYGLQTGKSYYAEIYYDDTAKGQWMRLGTDEQRQFFTMGQAMGIDNAAAGNSTAATSVYTLAGICLLHFEAGEALDTTSLAPGIYIVKTGNRVQRILVKKGGCAAN